MRSQSRLSLAAAIGLRGCGLWLQCALPDIGSVFVQPRRPGRHSRRRLLREPQRVHDSQGTGRRQARARSEAPGQERLAAGGDALRRAMRLADPAAPAAQAVSPDKAKVVSILPGETKDLPLSFTTEKVLSCHHGFELVLADSVQLGASTIALNPISVVASR